MAIHSTLHYDQDVPVCLEDSSANILSVSTHSGAHFTGNTQSTSMLHAHGIALPIGPLFGNDDYDQTHLSLSKSHGYTSAPTDGGAVVWYCSNCGDGPKGSWQNCCAVCSHVRCGGCTVEAAK
jgi:hypothetical protein